MFRLTGNLICGALLVSSILVAPFVSAQEDAKKGQKQVEDLFKKVDLKSEEETKVFGQKSDKEAIEVMKELWTKDEAEYHGHYYDFPPVRVFPKPIQRPHPPVFLGGAATNVFKRVVNYGDGWMPVRATPDSVRAGRAALDELADAAGRDPNSIQILIYGASSRDEIKQMEDAGANMATVRLVSTDPDKVMDGLEKLAEEMLG